VSASRFKVQKKKKVTCSHEDYQVLCQRVGDGKGRVVGNETMGGRRPVIDHPGNTKSHGKYGNKAKKRKEVKKTKHMGKNIAAIV